MVDDSGAALEARIDDDPDDPILYSVLGDWLQRRGDLRGKLIARFFAADTQRAADPHGMPPAQVALGKFLARHAATFLGRLERFVQDPGDPTAPPFLWRHGYIARAEIVAVPPARTRRSFESCSGTRRAGSCELYALDDLGDLSPRWGRSCASRVEDHEERGVGPSQAAGLPRRRGSQVRQPNARALITMLVGAGPAQPRAAHPGELVSAASAASSRASNCS
jgi:hypothetical protein